ncbi:MAG: hypothetical protein HUU18_09430 [Phycisphaerales bacterium]|nr:hypothetical protein [Phycisphaerales bacterium]
MYTNKIVIENDKDNPVVMISINKGVPVLMVRDVSGKWNEIDLRRIVKDSGAVTGPDMP